MARRRVWVAAAVLLVGLLLATGALWLALPGIARWAVARQIEAQTGRRVAMAAFDLDVPRRRIHVAGFRLADRVPGAPLLEFDTLDVRFRLRDLLRGRVHLREITLVAPRLRIVRTGRGVLNITDLLERPAHPTGPPAPFTLDRLAITGGTVLFEDHTLTPPRAWRAEGLTVEATSLSSMTPQPLGTARLATTVAGAPLAVEASGIALTPLQGRARVTLRDVDATLANLYLPSDTAVVLDKAKVGATIDATRDDQGGVALQGQARIDDIVVRRRSVDASLVTVPALVFNLTSSRSAEGRPLGRIEMNGRATVFDPRPGKSNRFEIDRLKLVADGIDAAGRQPARITATAALPGGGALDVQGSARPSPASAELRARISRVDLGFWAPYFSLPLVFTGMAETDLTLDAGAGTPRVRGRVAINGVTITDGTQRLAAADAVELTGIDTQWPKVRAERVRFKRPRATIRRDREGHLSITDLVETLKRPGREDTAAAPPPTAAEKPKPLPADFSAELGEVILEDARSRLDDATMEPPLRLRLAPIRLTVRDLTWPNRRPATVQLTASTPERGTIETQGTVTLDPVRFDLRTRLIGVELSPYRPYLPLSAMLDGRLEGDLTAKGTVGAKVEASAQGSVALVDVAFRDADRPILSVGRLELAKLDYTWPATATIERVHMQKSWVLLERHADGSLPIAGIFTSRRARVAPAGDSPAARPAPPEIKLAVREVRFEDGGATVVDAAVSPTARLEVAGVRLTARDFAWPPSAPMPVQMEAPTPGSGRLTARGSIDLNAHHLDLQVTPSGVDLAPMQPYLPVRGRVAGKASGDLQIKATLEPFGLTARGTASIVDMAFADDTRPLVTAARLETTGIEFAWPASLTVDRVRLQKPWAQIERAAADSFPLAALLAPPAGAAPRESSPSRAAEAPALDLRVRRAGIEDGTFVLIDATERPAARAEIRDARLGVRNFSWPAREAVDVRLRANTATGGSVDARGQVRLDTQAVDLQITAKQLDLATAQAFLPSRGTLAGKVDSDLRLKGTLKPLAVAATGSLAVDDTIFGDGQRMLAYIKRVDLTGIDADWPRRATVQRMAIDKPWALVEREADGRLPLLDLLFPPTPAATAAPASATTPRPAAPQPAPAPRPEAGAGPIIAVGELAVDEGFVRFVDRTTTPAFTEEASRMVVTGRSLGTVRNGKGPLTVTGRLTGGTPFEFKGTLGALTGPLNLDLDGKLTDFPLPRVNPYINKLIGWIARRGAFSTTVRYRVADNVLTASNDIVLGQPDFAPSRRGDEVRDRVGVPLGTLISLLKNARGEVRLSVPVTGNVATREFDFSDAFWQAVRKTAVGVVSLPVSWVGKIFYTEDARVETIRIWPVYFEPGTVRFAEGFDKQAQRVGTFLKDAPAVKLAMKSVLTVDDIAALKRDAVRQRLEGAEREAGAGGVEAAAARLFAERFPGRTAPGSVDAIVAELATDEPNPDAAAKALSVRRMEATRAQLQSAARIDPSRLQATEGMVPVEGAGRGRVEFEIEP